MCVIGIGGYSGAGKTTLIESALVDLKAEGLSVAVVKHTSHHRLDLDREGKDTDRFFRAGADFVCAWDQCQTFFRHHQKDAGIKDVLARMPSTLDLVLVEGYKGSEVVKVWLSERSAGHPDVPVGTSPSLVVYRDDPSCKDRLLGYIHDELNRRHAVRPLKAGLLIGGHSSRMGRPKALMEIRGETLVERSFRMLRGITKDVVLLGAAELPESLRRVDRLPDPPGIHGPMAGIISALRWSPDSTWIISAVDMPMMTREAYAWLLDLRRPGVWAVLPRKTPEGPAETAGACYEPEIKEYLEDQAVRGNLRLQPLSRHPRARVPEIPSSLSCAWYNINTPRDWQAVVDNGDADGLN